jgi:hypothetical protein
MSNTNIYDIVYNIDLRHPKRHVHTNLRSRRPKVTYAIVYNLHLPKLWGQTYDIVIIIIMIVCLTYDIVG